MTATIIHVHLADNEWGNELMGQVADELLAIHKDVENLVVHVYEHAGWFLQFAMLDGEKIVVGTANDAAVMSDKCGCFRRRIAGCQWKYLPAIRRT